MDARKSDGYQKTNEKIADPESLPAEEDFNIDYTSLKEALHNSTQITLNRLDKLIQESTKKSNKRLYLELFRALVVDSAQASESLFFLFEYITTLRASVLMLSMEMDKTNGKTTKEVKRLKTEVTNLVNSPAVVEIGRILQNMQKISDKKRNHLNEKPVKEYLR